MNLNEIYNKFDEVSKSTELKSLSQKLKNNSITDNELARLDEIVADANLKLEAESKIANKLFQKNRKFKLNNGNVLKITRGRTRNDSKVCFKVDNETKSNKLEYSDLIKEMYGLRVNYYGEVYTDHISDEFKSECDSLVQNLSIDCM